MASMPGTSTLGNPAFRAKGSSTWSGPKSPVAPAKRAIWERSTGGFTSGGSSSPTFTASK